MNDAVDRYVRAHIGHIEDGSFAVSMLQDRSGRTIICADTGNGGDTAYQVLEAGAWDGAWIEHGYAPTDEAAFRIARGLLEPSR